MKAHLAVAAPACIRIEFQPLRGCQRKLQAALLPKGMSAAISPESKAKEKGEAMKAAWMRPLTMSSGKAFLKYYSRA